MFATNHTDARSIRIAVADHDLAFRERFRELVQPEPDLEIVAEASFTGEVLPMVIQYQPDVLLLSLKIGGSDGFVVLDHLYNAKVQAKIIAIAAAENQDDYVRAVRLGSRGIILKTAPPELLLKSVRKVQEGELWLDRVTTALVLRQFAQELPAPRSREREVKSTPLSPREREIVGLVTQGYKNKELAEKLSISEQTVKNHMHNIFDKLGVSDRLELALYAIHNHLHEG